MNANFLVDVVIIGGGCAGLECASTLFSNGLTNLVLLEAQEYLGGRIKTEFINNDETLPLEMGATWIHGETLSAIDETVIIIRTFVT